MPTKQKESNGSNGPSRAARRGKPGSSGKGEYYHIEVRPRDDLVAFRTHDVGRRGHIQRVAGMSPAGSWMTVKWLIDKDDAHVESKKLVPDTKAAKNVIDQLGSEPVQVIRDRFKARPRRNVPERGKPTAAQKRARNANIKKAQAARRKKS